MMKCRVFCGKTGLFPMGRVFPVVRTVATVRFRVELEPEATQEIEYVANTHPDSCIRLSFRSGFASCG